MAKNLMNEAEQYLLKNWEGARLLEEAMDGVRTKYKEVCQRVVDAVTELHPKLDVNAICMTQTWATGQIALGKTSWPIKNGKWPTGFWISELKLEYLTVDDSDEPSGHIWVARKDIANFDLPSAQAAMMATANAILTPDELRRITPSEAQEVLLWFSVPSKREILDSLTEGDGQHFVDLFVAEFEFMARFIPALDRVFQGYEAVE